MIDTFKCFVKGYTRKFEGFDYERSSALPVGLLSQISKTNADVLAHITSVADKHKGFIRQSGVKFSSLKTTKNGFEKFLIPANSKSGDKVITQDALLVHLFIYVTHVLSQDVKGLPLIDLLAGSFSYINTDGKLVEVPYAKAFSKKDSVNVAGLKEGLTRTCRNFDSVMVPFTSQLAQEITEFLELFTRSFESLPDNSSALPIELSELSLAASFVKTVWRSGIFSPLDGGAKKVSNLQRVLIPAELNYASKSALEDLLTVEKDIELSNIAKQFLEPQRTAQDLLKFDDICDFSLDVLNTSIIAHLEACLQAILSFASVSKVLRDPTGFCDYLISKIVIESAGGKRDSDDISLLAVLRGTQPVAITGQSLSELEEQYSSLNSKYAAVKEKIVEVLNKYFTYDDRAEFNSLIFHWDYYNGRRCIKRVTQEARFMPQFFLSSALISTNGRIMSYKERQFTPKAFSPLDNDQKLRMFSQGVSQSMNHPTAKSVQSGYDVCVLLDEAALRSEVARLGRYAIVSIDTSRKEFLIDFTKTSEVFAIRPPKEGADVISFGCAQRYSAPQERYTIEKISPDKSDIIDLICAFPSRIVVGASQEELARLWANIFTDRTSYVIRPSVHRGTINNIRSNVSQSVKYAMAKLCGSKELFKKFTSAAEEIVVPNGVSAKSLGSSRFADFLEFDKELSFNFTLPISCLTEDGLQYLVKNNKIESLKNKFGHVASVVNLSANKENVLFNIAICPSSDIATCLKLIPEDANEGKVKVEVDWKNPEVTELLRLGSVCLLDSNGVRAISDFVFPEGLLRSDLTITDNLARIILLTSVDLLLGLRSGLFSFSGPQISIVKDMIRSYITYLKDSFDLKSVASYQLGFKTNATVEEILTGLDEFVTADITKDNVEVVLTDLVKILNYQNLADLSQINPYPAFQITTAFRHVVGDLTKGTMRMIDVPAVGTSLAVHLPEWCIQPAWIEWISSAIMSQINSGIFKSA